MSTPGNGAPAAPPRVQILLRDGTFFDLSQIREYVIGRRDQEKPDYIPDIDLTRWNGGAQGVSRQHARITLRPSGVFVEDLNSANRTLQNGFRLMSGQQYPLANGDELRLGLIALWVAIKGE